MAFLRVISIANYHWLNSVRIIEKRIVPGQNKSMSRVLYINLIFSFILWLFPLCEYFLHSVINSSIDAFRENWHLEKATKVELTDARPCK